jgi:hypothetical protein
MRAGISVGRLARPADILASFAWFAVGVRIIVRNENGQNMQKRKFGQVDLPRAAAQWAHDLPNYTNIAPEQSLVPHLTT